jgi:succinoglycan biosynthesis transport protein ExoP
VAALGRTLALRNRAILVSIDGGGEPATRHGFTDLVAGEASFAAIIGRENQSRLHIVGAGFLDGALLAVEWRAVETTLSAFDQTYDWVVCLLRDGSDPELLELLGPRMDSVVIASNEDPASLPLVDFYERVKAAGAKDVVVARDTEPTDADLVAA